MKGHIPVEKNESRELPVPTQWREHIGEIIEIITHLSNVNSNKTIPMGDIDLKIIESMSRNLRDYGSKIDPASSATWESSVYRWMNGYWQVLVDLFSEGEQVDLALFLRVTEFDGGYRFHLESIHVP